MPVPLEIPIQSFPTPVTADRVLVEVWDCLRANQQPLQPGDAHPNLRDFPNFVFVQQIAIDGTEAFVRRVFVNDRATQNQYNAAAIGYDGESNSHPEYTRDYLVRRLGNTPATKGAALTAVVGVKVTAGGGAYDTAPTVGFSGGAGSGATAISIVFRGAVVAVIMTAEGTGYTSAPAVAFTPTNGGTGATATAYIQPTTAILVKEDELRTPDQPTDSLYVMVRRIYQTVPGAIVRDRRMLLTGFLTEKTTQRVVAATLPAGGALVLSDKVLAESTVTAMREIDTVFTSAGGVPAAMPIYAFEEIDQKENVTQIRYEQEQPSVTAVAPNLDTAYGTAKVWGPPLNSALATILVTAPGTGFTAIPTVAIAAPTGSPLTQATATATLKVVGSTFAVAGSGYAVNDTVTASGGTGTAAIFTVNGFALATLALNAPGTGQNTGDRLTLVGGTFTTAGVVTIVTGQLVSVTPDDVGGDYVLGESITFGGGTFTTAAVGTVATLNVADTPTVNAAGTGALVGDQLTLGGGVFTTAAIATVSFIKLITITGAGGAGYVPGDDIYFLGGTFGEQAVGDVTSAKVMSATVTAGGTGDLTDGAGVIVEGTTGTGTKFRASVTIASNAIASVQSITVAGAYTANPTLITAEPVIYISGAGGGTILTGAQLSVVMGVNAVSVTDGGRYLVGSSTLTQYPYLGSTGTGATFTSGVYGVESIRFDTFASRGNYTDVPTSFTTSGGSGTGCTLNATTAGVRSVTITTPGSYSVTPTALTQSSSGSGSGATFTPSFGVLTFSISTAGAYTVTSVTFTQGATTGSGTGATFQTATYTTTLTITNAGNYTVIPANPVSTTTSGAGSLMTLTLTWGVSAITLTNAGAGYVNATPKVTITGTGTGARAVAYVAASVWRDQTAYIIDGGVEIIEGSTNKRVWWLTAPVPPLRREYPWESFAFPAIFQMFEGEYLSPFVARPGVNYAMRDQRAGTYPARLTIESRLGPWTDIQASFEVITRASQSNYLTGIGPNTIHGPIVIYEREDDGSLTLAESIAASTPTYAEYQDDGVYLVREWQERVWDSQIWQKFTLEVAEGYAVGQSGTGRSLPYFGADLTHLFT